MEQRAEAYECADKFVKFLPKRAAVELSLSYIWSRARAGLWLNIEASSALETKGSACCGE